MAFLNNTNEDITIRPTNNTINIGDLSLDIDDDLVYLSMYIICMLYVLSVIKASSVFCMYGLELSQTSTGPDQLSSSALFQHDVFPLRGRHIVDQVVGLLPLGQYLLLLTHRISMSFQIWYRDLNI